MPGGDTDILNGELDLSNLISPIESDEKSARNGENANLVDTLRPIAKVQSLNDMLKQLDENFDSTGEKIKETFESLRFAIDSRMTYLLNELKLFHDEKKALVSIQPSEEVLLERFDFEPAPTSVVDAESFKSAFAAPGNSSLDLLNSFISNYGRIARLKPAHMNIFECSIEGKGLSQCIVNEESCFTLSFKNKSDLRSSNVSFLDIYIITSEATSGSNTNNGNESNHTKARPKISISNRTSSSTNLRYTRTANCECALEVLAEGVYLVKYKLAKRGTYSLNILVNKNHIGESPYQLVCVDKQRFTSGRSCSSVVNVRNGQHNGTFNGDNPKIKSRPDSATKSSNLMKTLYSAKSTSSASLLLPSSSSSSSSSASATNHFKYSTPRSLTPSNMSKNKAFHSTQMLPTPVSSSQTSRLVAGTAKKSTTSTNPRVGKTTAAKSGDMGSSSAHNSSHDSSTSDLISPSVSKINLSSSSSSSLMMAMMRATPTKTSMMVAGEDDFLFQIGRRGRAHSEFMNPQAVCATADTIYVTDSNNQKIEAFSHNGEYKFTLGLVVPSPARIIRRPIGIDSSFDGKILCVDYELKCVNVFEESGKFLSKICQNRLLGPKGIAINKAHHNEIVIADSKANSVCIFDVDGKFLQRFGNLGSKNENFAGPQYVSCMSSGDIVVTDFYNHCIKMFDAEGKFKFSFGTNGAEQGQFNGPTGIATDSKDNIIVVDWGNSRIQVFDKHGNFIRFINSEYNQLYGPQDVAIINNTIAVADSGNHCVKIFEYS